MIAVIDANSIIGLVKGECFDLLPQLFSQLYVPPAVRCEVIDEGTGLPGEAELVRAIGHWIIEQPPSAAVARALVPALHSDDAEVLALALDLSADRLLTSDHRLRREASARGVVVLSEPEVLLVLKQLRLIPGVRGVLDRMRARGFGIAEALYQGTLRTAGE